MSEIKPALTAEEWAAGHTTNAEGRVGVRLSKIAVRPEKSWDDFSVIDIGEVDWEDDEVVTPVTSREQCDCLSTRRRDFFYGEVYEGRERHGVAALALYNQPFGFTREDVVELRSAADRLCGDWDNPEWAAPELLDLAARIEALLPPEGS